MKSLKNKNKNMSRISIWEKYYIHSSITTFIIWMFYLLSIPTSFFNASILNYKTLISEPFDWTVYPLKYVADPFSLTYQERKQNYEDIDSSNYIKIPKYNPEQLLISPDTLDTNSEEYRNLVTSRLIYTVVYMWNYEFDYKEYAWSHAAVDIITPTWTPVRTIANGIIVETGEQSSWFWKYIVIKHNNVLIDWIEQTIYSVYAHLNKITIKEWEKIIKWDNIGYVWTTWTSTTSHLHFQIELDKWQFTPFWPFTSKEAQESGLWFYDWITAWLWQEKAIEYTINPLVFINNNLEYTSNDNSDSEDANSVIIKEEIITEQIASNETNISSEENSKQEENQNINNSEESLENIINNNSEIVITPTTSTWSNDSTINKETEDEQISNLDNIVNPESQIVVSEDKTDENNSWIQIQKAEVIKEEIVAFANQDEELFNYIDTKVNETELFITKDDLFSDIEKWHLSYNSIKYFVEKWVIKWYSDNTFRPDNSITRAESLKVMLWALDKTISSPRGSAFLDIDTESWENEYINSAIDLWVINTDNNYFNPWKNISRSEVLKIILTLSWIDIESVNSSLEINDINNEDWKYKYAIYAIENNLVKLDSSNNFYPDQPITREELVNLLYNFVK